jgi:MFS family permease
MTPAASKPAGTSHSFPALRHPGFRWFLVGNAIAMLADNTEHVISYWMMFQKFNSAALAGFAVVSHWVPFLVLSIPAGVLADHFDPRKIIQAGMVLFMAVSIGWGILFLTDSLQMWEAMVLLVLHGLAGVLWGPASMVLIHYIVQPAQLPSAVRSSATARYLGMLVGPAVGSAILLLAGPAWGMFLNALVYLPLTLWLVRAPYGPAFSTEPRRSRVALHGLADVLATARTVAGHRTLLLMTLLAGVSAFFIGNSYQAQMPGFATDLGHGDPGLSYGALLAADAAGALVAGILLESRGLLLPRVSTALWLAFGWSLSLAAFALVHSYPLALALLFAAGFLELSFSSMAQALVQITAPAQIRGRVIGFYNVAAMGMRAFSGVTVGFVGSAIGIHWSLAFSAAALWVVISWLLFSAHRTGRLEAGARQSH